MSKPLTQREYRAMADAMVERLRSDELVLRLLKKATKEAAEDLLGRLIARAQGRTS